MSDVQDLYYLSLVVYTVDYTIITDANPPLFPAPRPAATRWPRIFGKLVYGTYHSLIGVAWKPGYVLLCSPLEGDLIQARPASLVLSLLLSLSWPAPKG